VNRSDPRAETESLARPTPRRAGLPHIGGPHGLRHSLASALDASGNGLATISALLGHASTAVTSKVYTHMLKGADRAAVDSHAATLLGDLARRDRPEPLSHPVRPKLPRRTSVRW
jgi:integrase